MKNVSTTAYIVTQTIVALGHHPRWKQYVPADLLRYSSAFATACVKYSLRFKLLSLLSPQPHLWIMEKMIFGLPLALLARKLEIEKQVRQAIAGGVKQVVYVGAGFDSLALRLGQEMPDIRFFELDHPATQAAKRQALSYTGIVQPVNCELIPCDLSKQSLTHVLHEHRSFQAELSTIYIMEGLTMYLSQGENNRLFQAIYVLSGEKAQIMFGALEAPGVSEDAGQTAFKTTLKAFNEGLKWSIAPENAAEYLENVGFSLIKHFPFAEMQKEFRTADELELLRHSKGEHYYLAQGRPA